MEDALEFSMEVFPNEFADLGPRRSGHLLRFGFVTAVHSRPAPGLRGSSQPLAAMTVEGLCLDPTQRHAPGLRRGMGRGEGLLYLQARKGEPFVVHFATYAFRRRWRGGAVRCKAAASRCKAGEG
jgi:hypothetical protein